MLLIAGDPRTAVWRVPGAAEVYPDWRAAWVAGRTGFAIGSGIMEIGTPFAG
jgi:hypothetical protein